MTTSIFQLLALGAPRNFLEFAAPLLAGMAVQPTTDYFPAQHDPVYYIRFCHSFAARMIRQGGGLPPLGHFGALLFFSGLGVTRASSDPLFPTVSHVGFRAVLVFFVGIPDGMACNAATNKTA